MKTLVVGSGGREHALVWKLAQDSRVKKIYCAPGNAGIARQAECVPVPADDVPALCDFARRSGIDMTIVGPEAALSAGIVDAFAAAGLPILGPSRAASQLEASKVFSKELMRAGGVPTAEFAVFTEMSAALAFVRGMFKPRVIKADGLCAGKGVMVCPTLAEQEQAIRAMLGEGQFGVAGSRIVIEEMLNGPELSLLVLTDGRTVVPLATCQDHKRIFDADRGPNTGGMGAYSPSPLLTPVQVTEVITTCIMPIINRLAANGTPYRGILYAGLMLTDQGPRVLEYNVRFGDPETQVILPRLQQDILLLAEAITTESLHTVALRWDSRACVCVVLAAGGYPGPVRSGAPISGIGIAEAMADSMVFHAGTRRQNNVIETAGGRVLGVVSLGDTMAEAVRRVYRAVDAIHFDGMQYRRDIGQAALGG